METAAPLRTGGGTMGEAPSRPALRYYGGKWRIAPWVLSYFPAHECYVEPYGGGASVLLRKRRSPLEIYNDLDGDVVSFFRVLREKPEELARLIRLTPWARAEYEFCREDCEDPLEAARRFYVSCWMGFGGGRARWRSGWRYQVKAGTMGKAAALSFCEVGHLYQAAERLCGVQIERRHALDVMRRCDAPTTLFYLDPPYVVGTRSKWKDVYAFEMDDDDHCELATVARGLGGMVLISGYPSALYAELYEAYGWTRVETEARTNGHGCVSVKRTEALWISPRTLERLECRDLPLFVDAGGYGMPRPYGGMVTR